MRAAPNHPTAARNGALLFFFAFPKRLSRACLDKQLSRACLDKSNLRFKDKEEAKKRP
eukprot:COSAG06_NODE_2179_length_7405_cov_69.786614_3_plen_58_part_00